MSKYVSKKGTTITIPKGADEKLIAKIKARADAGYGTDAQRMADAWKKQNGGSKKDETAADTAGEVDVGTEGLGETAISIDEFIRNAISGLGTGGVDLSGQPELLAEGDAMAGRQQVYDAALRQRTANFERDKARQLEAKKQEMAERGIPYSPGSDPNNPDNLYDRTIGAVEEDYRIRQREAEDAATLAADQSYATRIAGNTQQRNSFLEAALGGYNSKLESAATAGGLLNQVMQKYNIDQTTAQQILDRELTANVEAEKAKIARQALKPSGGGTTTKKPTASSGGFEIVG